MTSLNVAIDVLQFYAICGAVIATGLLISLYFVTKFFDKEFKK